MKVMRCGPFLLLAAAVLFGTFQLAEPVAAEGGVTWCYECGNPGDPGYTECREDCCQTDPCDDGDCFYGGCVEDSQAYFCWEYGICFAMCGESCPSCPNEPPEGCGPWEI